MAAIVIEGGPDRNHPCGWYGDLNEKDWAAKIWQNTRVPSTVRWPPSGSTCVYLLNTLASTRLLTVLRHLKTPECTRQSVVTTCFSVYHLCESAGVSVENCRVHFL